ncbi:MULTISPECIES: normocyte-binding protein [Clostridium]|uniref:Normocyte-binding protein n=1 Tax=Clostridium beijerinckii TaxID=1520 RepID=A0A1S9N2F0_CLOBE|nr:MULTISPECIES: normocyte-binding protein [Clostridium]MBN7576047.1 normocyte-binding protein [Clostridium beijerinckii]MBN7581120.1 normocyte-binding protein [Clostridium beijerinckii]MBN7585768.1 normocyte-binding protein [Clostridium beijerinckii]MBO0521557.1 normocyte-binding protein [Clostridium beijerinckii]MZK53872.1 normocyte-binding protein [Clostridium beijerinckii]
MHLQDIDLRKVYRIWKSNLGPFQGFFRSTPFVSLQTYDNFMLKEENTCQCNKNVLDIVVENCSKNNFFIVDLSIDEILNLAFILNNEYSIKPILNVNLLFHPFGIIGTKENINKLINNGLNLKEVSTEKFVMLIPYDRYNDDFKIDDLKDKLNNQYGINDDDLPNTDMLKILGYTKITILTMNKIKDDLQDYINFINEDIEVEVIKVRV